MKGHSSIIVAKITMVIIAIGMIGHALSQASVGELRVGFLGAFNIALMLVSGFTTLWCVVKWTTFLGIISGALLGTSCVANALVYFLASDIKSDFLNGLAWGFWSALLAGVWTFIVMPAMRKARK